MKTKEEIIKEYEEFDNVVPQPEPVELEEFTFEELIGEEYFKWGDTRDNTNNRRNRVLNLDNIRISCTSAKS